MHHMLFGRTRYRLPGLGDEVILQILAEPVVPTSKVGNGIQGLWDQYGVKTIAVLIIAAILISIFKMLMKHPVIFVIVIIVALAATGFITLGSK